MFCGFRHLYAGFDSALTPCMRLMFNQLLHHPRHFSRAITRNNLIDDERIDGFPFHRTQ